MSESQVVRVYGGVRVANEWDAFDDSLIHVMYDVAQDGTITETYRYKQSDRKDPMNRFVIGGLYQCTVNENGMYTTGNKAPVYLNQKEESQRCTEWAVESRAARAVVVHRRALKKEGEFDYIAHALAPIRKAMDNTNRQGKRAIVMLVLEELYKS